MLAIGPVLLPQMSKFILKLRNWNKQTTTKNYQAYIVLRKTGH